jgi:hypothetical protein
MGFLDKWKKKQEEVGKAQERTRKPMGGAGTAPAVRGMAPKVKRKQETGSIPPSPIPDFPRPPDDLPAYTVFLSEEDEQFMSSELKPLDKFKYGLAHRVQEYIVSGTNPEILGVLAGMKGVGAALWLNKCTEITREGSLHQYKRVEFFQMDREWDPVFIYRMAKVYQAGSLRDCEFRNHWLARFLFEIWAVPSALHNNRYPCLPLTIDTVVRALEYAGESVEVLVSLSLPGVGEDLGEPHPIIGVNLTGFPTFAEPYRDQIHEVLRHGRYRDRKFLIDMFMSNWIDPGTDRWIFLDILLGELPKKRIPTESRGEHHSYFRSFSITTITWVTYPSPEQEEAHLRPDLISKLIVLTLPWLRERTISGTKDDRIRSLHYLHKLRSIESGFLDRWFETHPGMFPFDDLLIQRSHMEQDPDVLDVLHTMLPDKDPKTFMEHDLQPSLHPEPRSITLPLTPITESVRDLIAEMIDASNASLTVEETHRHISDEDRNRILRYFTYDIADPAMVEAFVPPPSFHPPIFSKPAVHEAFEALIRHPDLTLIQLWKINLLLRYGIRYGHAEYRFRPHFHDSLIPFRESHGGFLDLRDLAACYYTCGIDPRFFLSSILESYAFEESSGWLDGHGRNYSPEEIWPLLAEHLPDLKCVFFLDGDPTRKQPTYFRGYHRGFRVWEKVHGIRLIGLFPEPPKVFLPLLWEYALGESPNYRQPARECLSRLPDVEGQILQKLRSRTAGERTGAVQWLSELRPEGVTEVLLAALKKEHSDLPKIAIIDALEKLGVPEEEFLDMEGLEAEATKMHAKGFPQAMEWFPFDLLPEVHWARSGKSIGVKVLAHFVLQAYRLKKPTPSALLRRYADHMVPHERERFGHFVLDRWIAHDTTVPNEAMAEIRKKLPEEMRRRNPEWFERDTSLQGRLRKEQLQKNWLKDRIRSERIYSIEGSAIKEKGILAIAASCCGPDAVQVIDTYLDTYYGYRVHQCRALLGVLSWIDDPDALDLLLRTAEYFRTTTIRKEAEKLIDELAIRRKWTESELADRRIPTGRFNRNHEFILKYPLKSLRAHLQPDLEISLLTMEGKEYTGRPGSLGVEYEPDYKEVEKKLSFANRVVRLIKRQEVPRLEEALWTGREWRFEDWDRYLNEHPIMSLICRTIVWEYLAPPPPDKAKTASNRPEHSAGIAFRPHQDGTLLDLHGDTISLSADPNAMVRIATPFTIPPSEIESWRSILIGAGDQPFIEQFTENVYHLPEELEDEIELKEFSGHIFDGTKLERLLKKMGYVQSPVEDGQIDRYVRSLSGSGFTVNIGVVCNGDPRTEKDVVLGPLFFARTSENDEGGDEVEPVKIPLGNVPPFLLSIARSHAAEIAKKGKEFDPDWETRSMT